MGAILATVMFGAPILDLRRALIQGKLGDLNPFPWAMMTGNCLGWVVYGYYQGHDPFIVAGNLPGLVLSLWLNSGAAKLQYQEQKELQRLQQQRQREAWDASAPVDDDDDDENQNDNSSSGSRTGNNINNNTNIYHPEHMVTVPQERALLRVLCFWSAVILWAGWVDTNNAAATVGFVVNLNLIFFYGAPLQTMRHVVATHNSASIHRPTLYMSWSNTSFWLLYGLAKWDAVIMIPNVTGLTLGLAQGVLCWYYPSTTTAAPGASHGSGGNAQHHPLPLQDVEE